MTDWIDRAQLVEERAREISLQATRRVAAALLTPNDAFSCEDCGDVLETERRAAAPGATRCTHCQEARERFRRTHAR